VTRVGYRKFDGTEVLHESGLGHTKANECVAQLKIDKSDDQDIEYFFLEKQTNETRWFRYGYIDN
jgi:hypothetical protein